MRARTLPLLLTLISLLAGTTLGSGCGHFGLRRQPATLQKGALADLEFNETLTRKSLKDSYPYLSPAAFKEKLKGSLESPLLFFRSWVNAYYHDLSAADLGPVALCMGDPHPENFGFIGFEQGPRFVFNDLDDSGECPIGADALRYFTALRLMSLQGSGDRELFEEATELYSRLVRGNGEPVEISENLIPDLEKKRRKLLRENTQGKSFSRDSGVDPVARETEHAIRQALEDSGRIEPGAEILAIGSIAHDTGGSGGLKRFWILVTSARNDILELKQIPPPGVSMGGWPQETSAADPRRFHRMMKAFWPDLSSRELGGVRVGSELYFLRSRTKASLKPGELKHQELKNAILAEVSLLARHHQRLWAGSPPDARWLRRNSEILSSRFQTLYETLGN